MINIEEISKILPQKFPFLMIDRVLSVESGKRLVAIKNVTINEEFFQGHFLGNPIMPGALIIEAMTQAAILLYASINDFNLKRDVKYYLGSVKANFTKPIIPGDQLRIEAVMVKSMPKAMCVETKAFILEEKAADAELICVIA